MKGTDLLEGLNFIDEAFVDEASDECEITKKKKYLIPFFVMEVAAACVVLFLVLSGAITVFLNYYQENRPDGKLVEVVGETETPTPNASYNTTDEPTQTENPVVLNTEKPKDDSSLKNAIDDGIFSIDDSVFMPQINDNNESIYPVPTKRPLPSVDDDYIASIDKPTSRPEVPNVPDIVDPTKNPSTNISGEIGIGDGSGNAPQTPKPTKNPNGDYMNPTTGSTLPPRPSRTPSQTEEPSEEAPKPSKRPSDWGNVEVPSEEPWDPSTDVPEAPPMDNTPMPTRQPTPSSEPIENATPQPESTPRPMVSAEPMDTEVPEAEPTPEPTATPTPTLGPSDITYPVTGGTSRPLPTPTPTPTPSPSPTPTPTPNQGEEKE